MTLFAAEVGTMLWILIATSLLHDGLSLVVVKLQILILVAETYAEHISITGYYSNDIDICDGSTIPAYGHLWVPCLAFDAILAVLSLWAGIQHSRQYSRSLWPNKLRLVDVLIRGNVIYFLRCAFITFLLDRI